MHHALTNILTPEAWLVIRYLLGCIWITFSLCLMISFALLTGCAMNLLCRWTANLAQRLDP